MKERETCQPANHYWKPRKSFIQYILHELSQCLWWNGKFDVSSLSPFLVACQVSLKLLCARKVSVSKRVDDWNRTSNNRIYYCISHPITLNSSQSLLLNIPSPFSFICYIILVSEKAPWSASVKNVLRQSYRYEHENRWIGYRIFNWSEHCALLEPLDLSCCHTPLISLDWHLNALDDLYCDSQSTYHQTNILSCNSTYYRKSFLSHNELLIHIFTTYVIFSSREMRRG